MKTLIYIGLWIAGIYGFSFIWDLIEFGPDDWTQNAHYITLAFSMVLYYGVLYSMTFDYYYNKFKH